MNLNELKGLLVMSTVCAIFAYCLLFNDDDRLGINNVHPYVLLSSHYYFLFRYLFFIHSPINET